MLRVLAFVAVLAISGCATSEQIMQGYVGRTLQDVMLDYGAPTNAFDMPDGSRAFQWAATSTYVMPTTVQTSTVPIGNTYMTNTHISGGQPITSSCTYTMLARWDEARNAWVFTDFRPPNWGC
jgi:hypothetical protein